MADGRALTAKEIETKVAIQNRIREVEKAKREVGLRESRLKQLQDEWIDLRKRLRGIEELCNHPEIDSSTGGGIFCSVCDAFLGMS